MPEMYHDHIPDIPLGSSDEADVYGAPDYNDETIAAEHDMLSDERPEAVELQDVSGTVPATVPIFRGLPDVGMHPTTFHERHYIIGGAAPIEGEHPDPAVREAVAGERRRILKNRDRFHTLVEASPNLNGRYEAELHEVRAQVAADFSEQAAGQRITLLAPEQYQQVTDACYIRGSWTGLRIFDHTIIAVDEGQVAMFGSRPLRKTALHEMAHGTDPTDGWAITTRPRSEGSRTSDDLFVGDYILTPGAEIGLLRPDPDMPTDIDFSNGFLEEATVESYAVKAEETLHPEWSQQYYDSVLKDVALMPGDPRVTYSSRKTPILHPQTGTVAIPWKYLMGVHSTPQTTLLHRSTAAMAAYGIQLLEKYALPGLHQELLDSRTNQALRPAVRERINSAEGRSGRTPLYDRLSWLTYDSHDFSRGTRWIIKALGIQHEPVDSSF